MLEAVTGFDWDDANSVKCETHGVARAVIEQLFGGSIAVLGDPGHSLAEERFKAIGKATDGRRVLIVFTLRDSGGTTLIRPISARYMHQKEVTYYEKTIAPSE